MSDAHAVAWDRFSNDPRSSQHAHLRASDLDRSVALDALSAAFADGRLNREEYDERSEAVQTGRTLGQLVAPLRDLAPDPASGAVVRSSHSQLQARAEQRYLRARQGALSGFLVLSLISWGIWLATLDGGGFSANFSWPVLVTVFASVRLVQVTVNRRSMIESIMEKDQRRERRRIEERPR